LLSSSPTSIMEDLMFSTYSIFSPHGSVFLSIKAVRPELAKRGFQALPLLGTLKQRLAIYVRRRLRIRKDVFVRACHARTEDVMPPPTAGVNIATRVPTRLPGYQ